MESITEFFETLTLDWVADLLSIITFGFTIYLFFAIRKIKNNYLFRARVPELLKALSKQATRLLELGNEHAASRNDITVLLKEMDVTLVFLKKKVPWSRGRSITRTRKQIGRYMRLRIEDKFWELYADVQKVVAEMEQVLKDSKWEN